MSYQIIEPIPKVYQDKRVSPRARTSLPAKIVFGNRAYLLDCTIKNISVTGARIAVPNSERLPNKIQIIELQEFIAFEAKIVWHRPSLIGVSFDRIISLEGELDFRYRALRMYASIARTQCYKSANQSSKILKIAT